MNLLKVTIYRRSGIIEEPMNEHISIKMYLRLYLSRTTRQFFEPRWLSHWGCWIILNIIRPQLVKIGSGGLNVRMK